MITHDEVRSVVGELGLCAPEELESLSHSQSDPSQFIETLAQSGRITSYQREMILSGNGRRLRLGDYRVESRIGAGGMGEVFLGYQPSMDRKVAIKVLDSRLMSEPELVQRFEREVKLSGRLLHAHVVTAFDAGHDEGRYFLVMEHVEGASLDVVVRSLGSMSVVDSVCIGIQTAQGLAFAHANGIVHRDVKPGNLLLNRQGVVKVLDLGLARFREAAAELQQDAATNLSQSGHMLGTVDYLSPEQALDPRQADERSDIYSLGCTLFRLLTGSAPYQQGSMMQRILAHREAPIPSLQERIPSIPASVAAVVEKMLAKHPEDRYASMNDVADALRQALPDPLPRDLIPEVTQKIDEISAPVNPTADTVVKSFAETLSRPGLSSPGGKGLAATLDAGQRSTSKPTGSRKWWIVAAGVVSIAIAVLATIVLRWEVEGGVVLLEVHAPNAQVLIDGQQRLTVTEAGKVYRLTADAGTHRVSVRLPDGTEIFGEEIEVQSGRETPTFVARFEPAGDTPTIDTNVVPAETTMVPETTTPAVIAEEGVLTVSQSGEAQFETIQDALQHVKPGETIRVLDDARYEGSIVFQGSRFEGVTLEAVNRATLAYPIGRDHRFDFDAPRVTVRGFRIVAESPLPNPTWGCLVGGRSPGVVLEDLHILGRQDLFHSGISIEMLDVRDGEDPVMVKDCVFEDIHVGLRLGGRNDDYSACRIRGVLITGNRFRNNLQAMRLAGLMIDIKVVGNRIERSVASGIQLELLFEEVENILIANNTLLDCSSPMRVWEDLPIGNRIEWINNITLGPVDSDWYYIHAETFQQAIGPGDGPAIHDVYRLSHNWREDDPDTEHAAGWIPPAETDVRQFEIEMLSRDFDSADYLRPPADSPLATSGIGAEGLPSYVGAVPPEGVEPWEWTLKLESADSERPGPTEE